MAPGLELHPDTHTNLSVLIIGKPLAVGVPGAGDRVVDDAGGH
jgi:hypothetical protein